MGTAGTIVLIAALWLVAMVLIIVEVCTPFFGMLGVLAVAAVIWSIYLAHGVHPVFAVVLGVVAVIGLPAYIALAVKYLPDTALGRRLHLKREPADPGEGTPDAEKLSGLVGTETEADTVLRPSGTVRVDGRRIVAQSESGVIEKGRRVRIIRAAGNYVVVRKIS